jgi:hypothetical protein
MRNRLEVVMVTCALALSIGCGAAATKSSMLDPVTVDPSGLGNVHEREAARQDFSSSTSAASGSQSAASQLRFSCDARYCDPQ